jgi:uncharacterized protein DUF1707/uncharacterized protein DUF4190
MTMDRGHGMAADGYGHMRASTADRERAVDVLKAAFAEGRLTADEYQERVGQVFSSRTYAELGALTADLPIGPFGTMTPSHPAPIAVPGRTPVNSLAVVSLICALIPGFPAAAAVITGFAAQRQISKTGERGWALATAGITIGGFSLALLFLFLVFHGG